MKKQQQILIFTSVIFLLIAFGVYRNFKIKNEFEKYGEETIGIITDYEFVHRSTYNIIYKFKVNDIEYIGERTTSYFECSDGTKGCKGQKFKIIYSKKNPNLNNIDLGVYEKFKKNNMTL